MAMHTPKREQPGVACLHMGASAGMVPAWGETSALAHLCRYIANEGSQIDVGETAGVEDEDNIALCLPNVLEVVAAGDGREASVPSAQDAFLILSRRIEHASLHAHPMLSAPGEVLRSRSSAC